MLTKENQIKKYGDRQDLIIVYELPINCTRWKTTESQEITLNCKKFYKCFFRLSITFDFQIAHIF